MSKPTITITKLEDNMYVTTMKWENDSVETIAQLIEDKVITKLAEKFVEENYQAIVKQIDIKGITKQISVQVAKEVATTLLSPKQREQE